MKRVKISYNYKNEDNLLITENRSFNFMIDFYKFFNKVRKERNIVGKPIIEKAG